MALGERPVSVLVAYRDSALRRAALQAPPGAPERYSLFGLDELEARGLAVRHTLEAEPPGWARIIDRAVNRALAGLGGYGGDFARVLPWLRVANQADVVLSTVDTVGIPLSLLARAGLLRSPLVYVAVGLPERLERLRGQGMRRLYASALRRAEAIVCYSAYEAEVLGRLLGHPRVVFLPFGVDVRALSPTSEAVADVDVVSVGADPRRDFALLLRVARRRPGTSFRLVVSAEHARALPFLPANVTVEVDLPFALALERMRRARLVALPVRENSYSGATTTLLQAMAMAKAVVVSRTAAIASGYGLEDGVNCRLVAPGDEEAFERAIAELLVDAEARESLGRQARATVEGCLSWERYVEGLVEVVEQAATGARRGPA